MKRFLPAFFLLSAVLSCGEMTSDSPEDVYDTAVSAAGVTQIENKAGIWLRSLCCRDLGGRTTGTEYAAKAMDYIRDELILMGLEPEIQTFAYKDLEFRNLMVTLDFGKPSTIVVGSHYDGAMTSTKRSFFPAAEDNASGCVTNLTFLFKAATEGLDSEYNVTCCFWDAEEVFDGHGYRGSEYFVGSCEYIGDVALYINLDTMGHRVDDVELIRSDRVQGLVDALVSEGSFEYSVRNPFDISSSDYVSFSKAGVQYVAVHDVHGHNCKARIHTTDDKVAAVSTEKLVKVADVTKFMIENYHRDE